MQLQQTTKDETPLYDAETVRRTLARAAEIEARESDAPLTAAQIEALGRELGLSPASLRRSLEELNRTGSAARQTSEPVVSLVQQEQESLPIFPDTRDIKAALVPALLYGLFVTALFLIKGHDLMGPRITFFGLTVHEAPPWVPLLRDGVTIYLPPLLALWSGWKRRDWRLGLFSGIAVCIFLFLGLCTALTFSMPYAASIQPSFVLLMLLATAFFGFLGGLFGHAQKRAKAAQERAANR